MTFGSLLSLLVILAVFGGLVWLLVTYIPMPATIRKVIIGVAVIGCVLFVLRQFGLLDGLFRQKI